jgi:histidinol-phosphate aminotransferase
MNWLVEIARPEIRTLQSEEPSYWEPGLVRLHANELPWRSLSDATTAGLNRYPELHPLELAARLAPHYGVAPGCVLPTRGSDEGIDLLVRAYCRAGVDAILVCPPTFGMYAATARIQAAGIVEVPLRRDHGYALDADRVIAALTPQVKLVFLCTPNNPTGNLIAAEDVRRIATALAGRALLVVDEAYSEFSGAPSCAALMDDFPGVVVLRTLSKAHGLAGARCGVMLAHPVIVDLLHRVIPPYAFSQLAIEAAERALQPAALAMTRDRVMQITAERDRVALALAALPCVFKVWPSAANFLLVEFTDAAAALERVRAAGFLVRDFRRVPGLDRALRITIGSADQNDRLLQSLT